MAASSPSGIPTPSGGERWNRLFSWFVPNVLEANGMRVKPLIIGRIPSYFLFSASRESPKISAMSDGQQPTKAIPIKAIKALTKSGTASRQSSRSRRCCGRRPSGPPAESVISGARRTSDNREGTGPVENKGDQLQLLLLGDASSLG